jgi:D-inositol-3-phosphate glycosyltransferase
LNEMFIKKPIINKCYTENMKIAMLSFHTCPLAILGGKDTGGMNVYVRDLTMELGRKGIHVDVFTRSQNEHVPHVLHDLGFGNRVVHIPAGPEIPLPKQELAEYISVFANGVKSFAHQKGIKYDLLHSHYWMSGIAALELSAAWNGIPVLQMFHTLGEMKNRVARDDSEKEGDYRLVGERKVMASANRLIAATPAEKAQLEWLYHVKKEKITIIPPGVDTSHFYPIPMDEARQYIGLPREARIILFVGRIEPLKGISTLIHAIACLKLNLEEPITLVIIGGDPEVGSEEINEEMTHLQKLCDELSLGKMVLFLGKRGQDTLPYYYSAAEVVVMPSYYESFGMVALEAMACGTPVIASQVGGLAYLVQDGVTGFTVPAEDHDALCEKLSILLDHNTLREEMGKKATGYASKYAWEKIASRVINVYEELIGSNE